MTIGSSDPDLVAGPVRQCVGCRVRTSAAELLRVVVCDGTLVPDPRRRRSGRGAWVHPQKDCLDLAERRRAFGRALRAPGLTDSNAVRQYLDTIAVATATGSGTESQFSDGARLHQESSDPS